MRKPTEPFSGFIDAFIVAKRISPTTREDYLRYLRDFDKATGHTSLKLALTLDNAAQWVDGMRKRGTHTARNGAMALKSMATWIAKSRYIVIPGGVSLLAGLETPKTPQSHRRAFTDEEMEVIYQALEFRMTKDRSRARAAIMLMAEAGPRRNEVRQIRREDLLVRPDRTGGAIRVRAETSKGNKERIARVGGVAIRAILAYLEDERRDYSPAPDQKNEPEPLFLTEQGRAFTKNGWGTYLDRVWDYLEKETGIKGSSHFLRHTWATNYARGMGMTGNSIYDFRREGGWSDSKTPERYTHERPEAELLAMSAPIDALRERRLRRVV